MNRICSNFIPRKIGAMRLTHILLPNGRVEGEATVTVIDKNHYYFVCAAVREEALYDWLTQNKQADEQVEIHNVSMEYGVIALAGPKSRDILNQTTDAPLDNENFKWLTSKLIEVAGVQLRALRVSFTGELGWELHTPLEQMLPVYEALCAAGEPLGMVHIGSGALNSMRMEKKYLTGVELANEVTLTEVDMLQFVRLDKDFIGADVTRHEAENGVHKWVLAYLQLDDEIARLAGADPVGGESVWHDGRPVGTITSGGYGYAVQAPLFYAFLKPASGAIGTELEVLVQDHQIPARVMGDPVFDPNNDRPRA